MTGIIVRAALPLAFGLAASAAGATVFSFAGVPSNGILTTVTSNGFTAHSLAGQQYSFPCGSSMCSATGMTVYAGGTGVSFTQGTPAFEITGAGLFTLGAFTFTRSYPVDNNVQALNVVGYRNGQIAFSRAYFPPSNYTSGVIATPLDGYQSIQVDRVVFAMNGFHSGSVADINLEGGVPEPASWALMLTGFGLLGGALRRRPMAGRAVTA